MEKRLARREKSRVLWIDGVRFLAFGVVFTRHYFESFFPENIPEVRGGISAFLWRGITGKAAVSMFCVLLGYFVAASVKKYAFSEYTIRRYLYFMTHLLVVNDVRYSFYALETSGGKCIYMVDFGPQASVAMVF